jgi:hypothetical protein
VLRDDIYSPLVQLHIHWRGQEIHASQHPEVLSSVQTVIEFAPIARLGVKVSVLALAETSLASV